MYDNRQDAALQAKMIDTIQREGEDEDELLQGKFAVQRQEGEEDELLQGKFTTQLAEEDEELMQGKFVAQLAEEDDELMQGKFVSQMQDEDELMQGKFETAQRQAENRTGIPDAVKQRMEDSFGTDFSSVRVHPDSSKAPEVGALAYTQGTDIHFAPGQFKPDTTAGQELLGHELTHVVQQAEGRVQPTTEIGGMPVNDNEALEHEADVRGAQAVR
ncbi:MAG TPA: cell division protein FtsK [Culturomica sp.]|nr:cell division protein FtsK [Culturomica sp.]